MKKKFLITFNLFLFSLGCQHTHLIPAQSGILPDVARGPSSSSVSRTVIPVVDPNDKIALDVWHPPTRYPRAQQAQASSIFARHMGPQFDAHLPAISGTDQSLKTGLQAPLLGASQDSVVKGTPTFVIGDGHQFGYYVDTKDLESLGFFPFPQKYCQAVGLGAPQLTFEKNISSQNLRPWINENRKVEISVDLQIPYSKLKVRTTDGKYVDKTIVEPGDQTAIFISSSFLYLKDTLSGKLIAILFNYYDPRGNQPAGIGNDNQVFFFSIAMAAKDSTGKDLSKFFTISSGGIQKNEFREFKNFKLSINKAQMKNLIAEFGNSTALSGDPANYQIQLTGLLNEMNFHYKPPASACVSDYDPQTSAQVGMSFQNFSVSIVEENSSPGK